VEESSSVPPGTSGPAAANGGIRVVDASGLTPAEWDDLAVRSPNGDALQSHAWGELKRSTGWIPLRFLIMAGERRVAVVSIQERPLMRRLPLVGRRYRILYAPRGPILLDPGAPATDAAPALAGLRLIARERRAVALTVDPAWDESSPAAEALRGSGFRVAAREVQVSRTAMIVPLAASEAVQRQSLGHTTYQDLDKAEAAGVTTERVDMTDAGAREAALAEFYDMHAATGVREGFIVRDRDYELRQWRSLGESGVADLWFAGAGRRDTGALLLHCGRNLVYFAAGSRDDADLRRTRANHLLQWRIIRWAAEHGFAGYDMGGVDTQAHPGIPADQSHPLWNLFLFKRRFGGRPAVRVRAHETAANPLLGAAWRLARRFR
jgi:peptidoglycan pentaglycine glycine transferase (the first glycine)